MNNKSLSRQKNISDIVISWLGFFAVLVSLIVSYFEYNDNKVRTQTDRFLELMDNASSDGVSKMEQKIDSLWIRHADDINKKLDGKKWDELATFVKDKIINNNHEANIHHIIDYYERISICVFNSICNKDVVFSFMGDKIKLFYDLHWGYIDHLRKLLRYPDYAKSVCRLVQMYEMETNAISRKC